jgi:hypothetical protein
MILIPLIIAGAIGLAIWLRPWPLYLGAAEPTAPGDQTVKQNMALQFGKWVKVQACARGLNVRGVARPVPIECPKCHKASNYFVYPDELCERCWRATLKPLHNTPVKGDRP